MRIIANIHKGESLRFISHLDMQRLMQRAMRRADLPLSYSQGFNPHPIMAFASALSVGYSSDGEWLDVRLSAETAPEEFMKRLNEALPEGLHVSKALAIEEAMPALTALIQRARYTATIYFDIPLEAETLKTGMQKLLGGPIIVTKHTKGGLKDVDIRPHLLSMEIKGDPVGSLQSAEFDIEGILNASGGLQIELLLQALMETCGVTGRTRVHRLAVDFEKIEV